MINIADLPCLRVQLELAAAAEQGARESEKAAVQYARAPEAPGSQTIAGRPPATQRNTR